MNQVALLHDAINNQKFGVIIKSELGYEFEGDNAHASEWANWANQQNFKSLESLDLPPGVVIGGFKNLVNEFKTTDLNSKPIDTVSGGRKNTKFKSSEQVSSKSKVPAILDTPIKYFSDDKFISVIGYKAAAFKSDAKKSSFLREVKSNQYAFNIENGKFNIPPKMEFKSLIRERVETNTSSSFERRLGIKMIKHSEFNGQRTAIGLDGELQLKSLGQTLGGSTGSGARVARRASGILNARFDPNAIDADGDKIIQEGTPFERPAVPVSRIAKRTDSAVRGVVIRKNKLQAQQNSETETTASRVAGSVEGEKNKPEAIASRGARSVAMGARARRESAVISNGLQSRGKKKTSKTGYGTDIVHENDGKGWEVLDDEQRKLVKSNLETRRTQLQNDIKDSGDLWSAYLRNPKNTKNGTNTRSDLTPDFLAQFQHFLNDDLDSAKQETDDKRRQYLISTNEQTQRNLDDLLTLNNMKKKDDYSLLEHLHPISRNAALGREQRAKNPEHKYEPVLREGQKVPTLSKVNQSTFFGKAGGRKEYVAEKELEGGEKAVVKKTTDTKLRRLNRRLFYPNPEREARKQRRSARKAGEGRSAQEASPVEAAKTRIRRARRAVQAKLRGDESPADVAKRSAKTAAISKHPLGIKNAKNGNPMEAQYTVTPSWIKRMAIIANETGAALTGENKKSRESNNTDLLNLWENNEFNALPTPISADVAERLIGAGWKPHTRGVGSNPGFGEAYLSEPDRFIPGQGGTVYGIGEYWAPEGSDHAWNYGSVNILGFLSPDARQIKMKDLKQIKEEGMKIQKEVAVFDAGHAGEEAQNMSPADYVTQLRQSMERAIPADNPVWSTPLGQVYKQTLDAYAQTPDKIGDKTRVDTWAALQQLNRTVGHTAGHDSGAGYIAPLLGYDSIDAGGGVELVHNRGAIVAVDHSMGKSEAQQIMANGKEIRTKKKAA
jgi:hypothetical protein